MPKDKRIFLYDRQKKAHGSASLYLFPLVGYPIEKPSAESTAVSVVRAML